MLRWSALVAMATVMPAAAGAQDRPDQKALLALYRKLVETDTTLSNGS